MAGMLWSLSRKWFPTAACKTSFTRFCIVPTAEMTREAIVVHFCDDMTARVAAVDEAERATAAGERWSAFSRMLETFVYVGGRDGATEDLAAEAGARRRAAAPDQPPRKPDEGDADDGAEPDAAGGAAPEGRLPFAVAFPT